MEEYKKKSEELLIVPYGIETRLLLFGSTCRILLIVPYGIETSLLIQFVKMSLSFNRTLWN